MPPIVGFNYLCPPAYIYLVISLVFLILTVIFLNNGTLDLNQYCIDSDCTKPNIAFLILFKAIFILFWAWLLNFICRLGYPKIAWGLFILPFVFSILGLMIIYELVKKR